MKQTRFLAPIIAIALVLGLFACSNKDEGPAVDTQIDISHLSKGIYIIRAVTEDGGIIQTKLIHM